MGCFEPQRKIWSGESGQAYNLPSLIRESSDFAASLDGLAKFDSKKVEQEGYSHTIFRLPLRTEASGLSDNTYNTQRLTELLDALREEAKYLLLFLKSVCKIEVVHISQDGQHKTSFCVEIAPSDYANVSFKRDLLLKDLTLAHKRHPYQINNVISFTAEFSVAVTDNNSRKNQAGTSRWLVTNYVGSADPKVQAAAEKQCTFPWVGAALELGDNSAGGRIFCFLPMPIETSSGLPIHVNGTFGLNDERRTLKWPEIERRNDPTANWNKTLVSQLLPPCYAMLLIEARNHLSSNQFYNAWPDVEIVKNAQFSEILQPLFTALFRQAVVWTDRTEAVQMVDNWVLLSQVTFISEGINLPSVIKEVLSSCGVQLATIPAVIWRAIQLTRVSITVVSPQLVRFSLRSYSGSYYNIDQYGKRELLTYCLSDNCYSDLSGLNLLPLANGTFTIFDNYYGVQTVYLCSANCPRSLLPSLDHLLVDMSDDPSLQMSLYQVAASLKTRLRVLTEKEVARVLTQAMPSNWRSSSLVSMPHSQLTFSWLQTFWEWLGSRDLSLFSNQLLVPCYSSNSNSTSSFYLTRLNIGEPVVYISKHISCSNCLLSALYKMSVRICLQSEFSFVQHKLLSGYVKYLNTNNVLDAVYSQSNYKDIIFSIDEADSLRTFLVSGYYTPSTTRTAVLQSLTIFTSASNSHGQLYSINSAASQSVSRQALGEPSNCTISVFNLPPNLILFSRGDYLQLQLMKVLKITFRTDYRLLVNYVFPLISNRTFPDHLIDNLMTEVLDMFNVLNSREKSSNLSGFLQGLPFVKTLHGRKCPLELFNPLSEDIAALYNGEDVFPQAPYNTFQRIHELLSCGLRTSATPQHVLDIVCSICSSASPYPQQVNSTKLNRAKAVLKYISTPSFFRQTFGYYTVPVLMGSYPFSSALKHVTTTRSWLPVLSERPSGYCDKLPWKGNNYNSHFVSLSSSVALLSSSTAHTLPHLVGSQMYLVSPTVSSQTAAILSTDSADITQHVVAHFREILARKDQLSVKEMDSLVHQVYRYMNSEGSSGLEQLYAIKEWIYLKRENRLMAPSEVPMKQNPSFRQDLEPYIYILPDSLSQYTTVFGPDSGVKPTVSQDQILAILASIKEEVATGTQRPTAQETWDIVMSILNWLTNNGYKYITVDPYVPVEAESEWPKLVTASEVVYTDNDFMKDYLQSSDERDQYVFVHGIINPRLAQALGVVPLTEFMDISEDTFKDAGQHEPLTTRLKNILRDYKDGLTIIKELLQNADDAEATELNICYDARRHETDPKKLFFSGMAEAHGPALIVHNNSTFSDDDFKNITKLAAATKQDKALKIGKFGVGFCSVYHMTDVPSFISRDYFYVFDPTLSYLQKEVKSSAKPGRKLKFAHKLISHSKQLEPYNGLFGFNKTKSYHGTMFRLPFRTHASELSGTRYTEETIKELIEAIRESSAKLLLFLRHIKTITFQRIDPDEITPVTVLKITKETVSLPVPLFSGTDIEHLSCTDSAQTTTCDWLVTQKSETNYLWQGYFTASAACPLGSSDFYKVDTDFEGEVFCFLPLSQKTGLPVHVSSNFAVINNRRGIWTSDEATSQTEKEVTWNIALMKGVIARAYHAILLTLKEMAANGSLQNYSFYSLLPKTERLLQHNPWTYMLTQLYELIASEPEQLFYSAYQKQWLHFTKSRFLTSGILCQSSEQLSTLKSVKSILHHLYIPVVDLPITYQKYLNLKNVTIDESMFIKMFFENLDGFESILSTRSEVVQHMLEVYAAEYDDETDRSHTLHEYFRKYTCIPCMPDGKILRKCAEVVDPKAEFAPLFDSSEGYLPLKQLSNRHLCYIALRNLGMISEILPVYILKERARTILKLCRIDKTKALMRVQLILATMRKSSKVDVKKSELSSIPFLPVLPKPQGYHFPWSGDNSELMCAKDLMIVGSHQRERNSLIVGSQVAFVNEQSVTDGGCGSINEVSIFLLEIRKSPLLREVIAHLTEVEKVFQSHKTPSKELISNTDSICLSVYEFLDGTLKPKALPVQPEQEPVYADLKSQYGVSHVWTGKQFVETEKVAKEWNIDGPYLYPWHSSISSRTNLIKFLQLKQEFAFMDAKRALEEMQEDFGGSPVDEHSKKILVDIVALLQKCDLTSVPSHGLPLMLPDKDYVLCQSNNLVYRDVDLALNHRYVNEIIPPKLAKQLGVQALRSKLLEQYDSHSMHFGGITLSFGQHEELTMRIQNILNDCPLDITILKELLQNAEDAKATKMYIILDCRTHGSETVLSKDWGELQGPALLVWNDSIFSEDDLLGIQMLGLGSKRGNFEAIGQFGIGFNVVYHLTDCPSFITGGDTLCVLDPHCRYVLGADERYPGRRFDQLSKGFWGEFQDMGSAFLQSGLDNCPQELKNGSLFRLPLRHTLDHQRNSKIVKKDKDGKTEPPITASAMKDFLEEWAPQLKQSLLFLTSVKQLCFMVVEENSKDLKRLHEYCAIVDDSALQKRREFQEVLSAFKNESDNQSLIIMYPLTLSDTSISASEKVESIDEKWLIQQGVGDIENEHQEWTLINFLKPRYGIAALLHSSHTKEDISGQLFCFLPLPIGSNLPVHINGNFLLHVNRRSLWKSPEFENKDNRSSWNDKIFQALTSSYANFLDHARHFFVSQSFYSTLSDAKKAIRSYYKIFPDIEKMDKDYQLLVHNVYVKIVEHNSSILAVVDYEQDSSCIDVEAESKNVKVSWHSPRSATPFTQVYFAHFSEEWEDIWSTAEDIGMTLTKADISLQYHLNLVIPDKESKLKVTNPDTVFNFYARYFCAQASQFPCAITSTVFKTVTKFKRFTQYLLAGEVRTVLAPTEQAELSFPEDPFDHPLLLTADSVLRRFNKKAKVIKSHHSHLFSKAQQYFLHPDLVVINFLSIYFLSSSPSSDNITVFEYSLKLVHEIFSKQFPQSLKQNKVEQLPEEFSQNDLIALWKCLSTDEIFSQHQSELLKEWALLPDTSGTLYKFGNHLEPLMPLEIDEETDEILCQMFKLLQHAKMPFLDTTITGQDANPLLSCPNLQKRSSVLKALYHLNSNSTLKFTKDDVKIAVFYLKKVEFRFKLNNQEYVRALPLFESVDGEFRALHKANTYIWPRDALDLGFSKWNNPDSIFLLHSSSWKDLDSPEHLRIQEITEEALYYKYIFESFPLLTEMERYEHLLHIRDKLFPLTIINMNKVDSSRDEAITFKQALTNLPCIDDSDSHTLRPVKHFYNNKIEILAFFNKEFQSLPDVFTHCDTWGKWLEFFKKLGLKHTVSKLEFLEYCKEAADRNSVTTASSVLLEYLFSETAVNWHNDTSFCKKVADIPFVPAEQVPELTWIHKTLEGRELVRLNEAATLDCSVFLWTVKLIVKLPKGWQSYPQLLEQLGTMNSANTLDVLQNLLNICTSDILPREEQHSKGEVTTVQLMTKHFEFLQQHPSDESEILKDIHCIPVNMSTDKDNQLIMLVKPSCVIFDGEFTELYPYLHQLDPQLLSCSQFLKKIGVELTLSLRHLQLVLEQAYKDSNGKELVQQTKRCISEAVRNLFQLLSDLPNDDKSKEQTEKIVSVLHPLYLPNHEGKLALSTTLLYIDNHIFEGIQLESTDYSLLQIERVLDKSLLLERDLCEALPELVKPIPLSSVCILAVADECERTEHTNIGEELVDMLKMGEDLLEAIVCCVQFFFKNPFDTFSTKSAVHHFLSEIRVITFKTLKMTVTFQVTGERIGTIETKFYLNVNDLSSSVSSKLYLDYQFRKKAKVIRALSDHLLHLIRKTYTGITNEAIRKLPDILFDLLDSKSSGEVIQAMDENNITAKNESWRTRLRLVTPNPEEGRRWLKQAEANYKSLLHLHSGVWDRENLEMCGDVCFMAHQVAEKALKGAMYFLFGLDNSLLWTHHLHGYASTLEREHPCETVGLISHASSLESFYLKTRYPNMWLLPKVPAENYEKVDADAAKHHAEAILEIVKKLIVS